MNAQVKKDLTALLEKYRKEHDALNEAKKLSESSAKLDLYRKIHYAKTAKEKLELLDELEAVEKKEEKWKGKTPKQLLKNMERLLELDFAMVELQGIIRYAE